MKRLGDPAFVHFAEAFDLVVMAAADRIAPDHEWQQVIAKLHGDRHHLMAHAVQWHYSLYASGDTAAELKSSAEQAFAAEGCAAPAKLLDIILPLP